MAPASSRASRAIAAGSLVAAVLVSGAPLSVHDRVATVATVAAAVAAAAASAAFRRGPAWGRLAAALVLWAAGDALFATGYALRPGLLLSDAAYLAGVVFLIAGVRRVVVERGARGLAAGLLDAAAIAAAAGAIWWQVVGSQSANGPVLARLVAVAYPLSDALVLGLLAWLLFIPGAPACATRLLAAFLGVTFVADVLWAAMPNASGLLARVADPLYTIGYGLLAAAVAHPSAVVVSMPRADERGRMNLARPLLVTVAVVVSPAAAVVAGGAGGRVAAGLSVAAAALVATRLVSLFVQNHRGELALLDQARTYQVTGLANRTAFSDLLDDAVARLLARRTTIAVLFVDLDRFKAVNDGFGHAAGDDLLRQVADRLRRALPDAVAIARFGGDEFAAVVDCAGGREAAVALAWAVHAAIVEPYALGSAAVTVGASIGVADCDRIVVAADLVRDADAAMYDAKRGGGDPVRASERSASAAAERRRRIAHGLARSGTAGGLSVAYQPIVRLREPERSPLRLRGFEALARFHDPVLGAVTPVEFIAVAEDAGLVEEVGRRILDDACSTLVEMGAGRAPAEHLVMNVNLSARQLEQPSLVSDVRAALTRHRIAPEQLVLEITESTLMRQSPAVEASLSGLRKLGVGVALDDFGTGASSLTHLNRLPMTIVKIDRSFVAAMDPARPRASVVAGILALARTIGCSCVVEGIETAEQAEAALAIGAAQAQGYYFGRPLGRAEAVARATASVDTGASAPGR